LCFPSLVNATNVAIKDIGKISLCSSIAIHMHIYRITLLITYIITHLWKRHAFRWKLYHVINTHLVLGIYITDFPLFKFMHIYFGKINVLLKKCRQVIKTDRSMFCDP